MCTFFELFIIVIYIGRVHGAISACTVLWEVHPASAHNKSLISGTGWPCKNLKWEKDNWIVLFFLV